MRLRLCVSMLIAIAICAPTNADDWPQWGGPQRDLVWRETGIVERLPAVDRKTRILPRMWTAKIGAGYAGPAVAAGRVYVADRIADGREIQPASKSAKIYCTRHRNYAGSRLPVIAHRQP